MLHLAQMSAHDLWQGLVNCIQELSSCFDGEVLSFLTRPLSKDLLA